MSSHSDHAPLVSVGLPVWNGEKYLPATLESLLNQTFPDFELIISDNGSTDRTAEICQAAAARDARVRYSRFPENIGAAKNYNHTFALARGRYFKWAAHDDLLKPRYLEACVAEFGRHPETVVVYPRTELIDSAGRINGTDPVALAVPDERPHRRLWNYYKQIKLANPVFGLIRADALRQTRLIDSFVKSDITLLAELLMLGQFRELPEQLFLRRIHDESSVRANRRGGALLAWFDPSQRGLKRWIPVQFRLTWECLRSVCRMPLPFGERLRCLGVTLWWRTWLTISWYGLGAFGWLRALPRRAWRFITGRRRGSNRSCPQ
jgi:glycosyltransferase involved in cell wall biosynthesis